ncbi:MAG: universal stress protein [Candidatus Binatia bacterium]
MDKIKKILAPTDLSELSRTGIRYALDLGRMVGAEVTIYHVINHGELIDYGEETQERLTINYTRHLPQQLMERFRIALARFLKDNFSDLLPLVDTREKVEIGKPDKTIVDLAKREGASLIVMSTHGRTGLAHVLVGSVTEKVVRNAGCPVLSIHPDEEQRAVQMATALG